MVIDVARLAGVLREWVVLLRASETGTRQEAEQLTRAYEALTRLGKPQVLWADLDGLPGFDHRLMQQVIEYKEMGKIISVETLKTQQSRWLPLLELTKVRGVGIRKAKKCLARGIATIAALKQYAVRTGKMDMAARCDDALMNRTPHTIAEAYAFVQYLRSMSEVHPVGGFRRRDPIVKQLYLLTTSRTWPDMVRAIQSQFNAKPSGNQIVVPDARIPFVVRQIGVEAYGNCMQQYTGSPRHNTLMQTGAKYAQEEELYAHTVGYWVPPPLRDHELVSADAAKIVEKIADLGADHHIHYVGPNSRVSRSLHPRRIMEHAKYVSNSHMKYLPKDMELWAEVSVESDGTVELPDIAVGYGLGVHDNFFTHIDHTTRMIRAMRKAAATRKPVILCHPKAGFFPHRLGIDADWPKVFAVAARLGVRIEVNGSPKRLDYALLPIAKKHGCKFVFGSDSKSDLDLKNNGLYALWMAQKAGLKKEDFVPPRR